MPVGPTTQRAASVLLWILTGVLFALGFTFQVRQELFLILLSLAVLFTFNWILDRQFSRSRGEIYRKVNKSLDEALTRQDEAHRTYLEGIHDTIRMFAIGRHLRVVTEDPRRSG